MNDVAMMELQLADLDTVMRSNCEGLSKLPDDILCTVLSYVTLRDAARTRVLSSKWRYLPFCHSILQFDALNVFGNEDYNRHAYQSKFVRAVEQVLQQWRGVNVSLLRVNFLLGNEHASHIDTWIESAVRMKAEELVLQLYSPGSMSTEKYVFSGHLLSGSAFYLKALTLGVCELAFSSRCMNWINQLSTLHLGVPLEQNDVDNILHGDWNLKSLRLNHCCTPMTRLNVKGLPYLKTLIVGGSVDEIKLSCPNIEIFEYMGPYARIIFSHVPRLREVRLSFSYNEGGCSSAFLSLTKNAPRLQGLSLFLTSEVVPLRGMVTLTCLKRLDLLALFPAGFDLCTIIYFLKFCPFLQILHIKLSGRYLTFDKPPCPQINYPDYPFHHLKEVQFEGFWGPCNDMKLVLYLLKNAVALERMTIEAKNQQRMVLATLQNINTSAELVIL